jgi:hypothetical protein
MNCTDFERCLHDRFGSSRISEPPELAEHAGLCAECRATLDHFRLLADSLPVWRDQIPDVDLTGAVMKAWQSTPEVFDTIPAGESVRSHPARPASPAPSPMASTAGIVARPFPYRSHGLRSRRRQWLVAGSLLATVVAAIIATRQLQDAPLPVPGTGIAKQGSAAIETAHNAQQEIETPDAVTPPMMAPDPVRAPYYDLAQKAAGALGEMTVFVTSGSAAAKMPPPGAIPEETTGWIDGLQHQLRPIGRSLDDAFDFLWQAGQSADSSKT